MARSAGTGVAVELSHATTCVPLDGEWTCAPDCPTSFTGLDFIRGRVALTVRGIDGRHVIAMTDPTDSSAPLVELGECSGQDEALLLQQALMMLTDAATDEGA